MCISLVSSQEYLNISFNISTFNFFWAEINAPNKTTIIDNYGNNWTLNITNKQGNWDIGTYNNAFDGSKYIMFRRDSDSFDGMKLKFINYNDAYILTPNSQLYINYTPYNYVLSSGMEGQRQAGLFYTNTSQAGSESTVFAGYPTSAYNGYNSNCVFTQMYLFRSGGTVQQILDYQPTCTATHGNTYANFNTIMIQFWGDHEGPNMQYANLTRIEIINVLNASLPNQLPNGTIFTNTTEFCLNESSFITVPLFSTLTDYENDTILYSINSDEKSLYDDITLQTDKCIVGICYTTINYNILNNYYKQPTESDCPLAMTESNNNLSYYHIVPRYITNGAISQYFQQISTKSNCQKNRDISFIVPVSADTLTFNIDYPSFRQISTSSNINISYKNYWEEKILSVEIYPNITDDYLEIYSNGIYLGKSTFTWYNNFLDWQIKFDNNSYSFEIYSIDSDTIDKFYPILIKNDSIKYVTISSEYNNSLTLEQNTDFRIGAMTLKYNIYVFDWTTTLENMTYYTTGWKKSRIYYSDIPHHQQNDYKYVDLLIDILPDNSQYCYDLNKQNQELNYNNRTITNQSIRPDLLLINTLGDSFFNYFDDIGLLSQALNFIWFLWLILFIIFLIGQMITYHIISATIPFFASSGICLILSIMLKFPSGIIGFIILLAIGLTPTIVETFGGQNS